MPDNQAPQAQSRMGKAILDKLQSATLARYATPFNRVRHSSSSGAGVHAYSIANFLFFDDPIFHESAGIKFSFAERQKRMTEANVVIAKDVIFPRDKLIDEARKKSITTSPDFETKFMVGLDETTQTEIRRNLGTLSEAEQLAKTTFDEKYIKLLALKSDTKTAASDFRRSLVGLNELGNQFFQTKHEAEKRQITHIFSPDGARGIALKKGNPLALTEADNLKLNGEKEIRLKALAKAQAEELKVYNDEMAMSVESAHKAHVAALEKVNFINMIKNNTGMMKVLKSILPQDNAGLAVVEPSQYGEVEFTDEQIANIDLDKLQGTDGIKTETGLNIKVLGNGVYELNFPNHWLDKGYYLSGNNNLEADLKTIMLAARLKGDKVTVTLSDMNEEKSQKAARAAFNGWASLGYDTKDLQVKISSKDKDGNPIIKTLKYKDIYPDDPEEHKEARKNYKEQMNALTATDRAAAKNPAAAPPAVPPAAPPAAP